MKDNPINCFFDINGVLLDWNDAPIIQAIDTLIYLSKLRNVQVGVWSHRGKDYANFVVDELLGVRPYVFQVAGKDDADAGPADICFDDQMSFNRAKFNLITTAPTWKRPHA